jgi:hypothetical protein
VILLIVSQIEFPSILLPPSITSGSIVDITVAQNHQAEQKEQASFVALQEQILKKYGLAAPIPPNLRLRGATQTSLVLEWDPIQLATSSLRSLSLYRNNSKAGNIPRPLDMFSTKISGLAVDTEYSFHLVLRTSGGTYASNTLNVRTHKMTDLTGIVVTPGVLPQQLRESLEVAVQRIGGRMADSVKIDTTHFVCTEGRGRDWERAVEMNIPVVRPEWVEGCEREGRIVGVRGYYLDANPKDRQVGANPAMNAGSASRTSPAVSVPSGAGTGAGSQSSLPSRGTPKSAMKDSPVIGEPGPEVPPTPPPKLDNKAPPIASADEDEDDEEDEEDEEPAEKSEHESATTKEAEGSEARSSSHFYRRKSSAEDDEDGKGSTEMDEVPL